MWSSSKVRKETSPRVRASINNIPFDPVIDEGSEINCVSEDFVRLNEIKFIPTPCSASSADSTKMGVVGQTKNDVVISVMHNSPIIWDLGRCVVVKNLSVDMLIGEPGKADNRIITLPHLKKIKTKDMNGETIILNYSNKSKDRHLCKVSAGKVLLVGESIKYELPVHLKNADQVAISPIREHQPTWITSKILQVNNGHIELTNETSQPVLLKRNSPFADVVDTVDAEDVNMNINKYREATSDATILSSLIVYDLRFLNFSIRTRFFVYKKPA